MTTKSNWDVTEEMVKRRDRDSGLWMKLTNDGDKETFVFLGEPSPREGCFNEGRFVPFDDAMKAQGLKSTLRIAINVAIYNTREIKIFEFGVTVFKDLVRLREKFGLDKWAFEMQRHGAAKDPKTTYSILPDHQLTVEEIKEFKTLKLHDLEELHAADGGAAGDSLGSYDRKADRKADGTIDSNTVQVVTKQLKTMPREAVERFCAKFGITRVRDLPSAQIDKARAFLEVLATEFAAPTPKAPPETDPFA